MAGLQLGLMFAGIVIVETIFAWPGIGWYMAQSIPTNDFAAIGAVTLILGAAVRRGERRSSTSCRCSPTPRIRR